MRIPSGVVDEYIYFMAVDATDKVTAETGLSSFTVYRSRNGGAAVAMGSPTINETSAANMPGVYELLLDEDMTIDSGDDSQEMIFFITHAGAYIAPRIIELYRPKITAGETLTVASGRGTADVTYFGGAAGTFAAGLPAVNATQISGDAAAADNLEAYCDGTTPIPANAIQISGDATAADNLETAFDDTAGPVPWQAIADQGTAQAATATTLQLRAGAVFGDTNVVGMTLNVFGSTQGYWQSRAVTAYVGATDTATVDAWTTTPTGTITYKLLSTAPVASGGGGGGASAADVWAYATRTLSALDEDSTTLDLDATIRAALGLASANLDTQVSGIQSDTNDIQTRLPAALVSGRIDASVGAMASGVLTATAIAADAITATKLASDVTTEIQAGLATAAALTTVSGLVDDLETRLTATRAGYLDNLSAGAVATAAAVTTLTNYVDTEVAAILADTAEIQTDLTNGGRLDLLLDSIKSKTDSLVFTVAGSVDANIRGVNSNPVSGDGQPGTEWGPP